MDSELATNANETGVGEQEQIYIVRIMCQEKSRFVEFVENELDIKKLPEKSKQEFYVYCYFQQK